jgi:hypothetical protein
MDLGFLSGPLGAIFGGLGAIAGKIIDLKAEAEKRETLKLQLAHELALRDKDMAQAQLEASSKLQIHQVDADSQLAVADLGALAASVQADRAAYGDHLPGRIVDLIRGVTRPVITAASMFLLGYMTVKAFGVSGGELGADRAAELLNNAQFIAGTAITWWFGARASRPAARGGR